MNKRMINLFVVFLIGICLSMPLSASAAASADGTDPVGEPTNQCTSTTQKYPTSSTATEDGSETTDGQTEEPANNDCTDWQTAPVSWNS